MAKSSKQRARSWPYPRQAQFRKILERAATAWFRSHGHSKLTPGHILPSRGDWADNVILKEVSEYIDAERIRRQQDGGNFALHMSAHHGLNSQALAFNLLGPLVVRKDFEPLGNLLGSTGAAWPQGEISADFAVEDPEVLDEDSGQPTLVDFVIRAGGRTAVCVTVRLVEPEFRGCPIFETGDCDGRSPAGDFSLCYLHHIGRGYWKLLEKHGFLEAGIAGQRLCVLAAHYQFFRGMLFALEKDASFVLICDDRGPTFSVDGPQGRRGLMPLLEGFVPEKLRERIAVVTVTQLLESIESSGRHGDWTEDFRKKYALEIPE